jgi:hypothetical protein
MANPCCFQVKQQHLLCWLLNHCFPGSVPQKSCWKKHVGKDLHWFCVSPHLLLDFDATILVFSQPNPHGDPGDPRNQPSQPSQAPKTLDLPELGKAAPQAPRQGAHGTLGDRAMETEPRRPCWALDMKNLWKTHVYITCTIYMYITNNIYIYTHIYISFYWNIYIYHVITLCMLCINLNQAAPSAHGPRDRPGPGDPPKKTWKL